MSDSLSLLLLVLATFAVTGLAVGFVLTAFRRKKAPCPECGAKTMVARAAYKGEVTGELVPGEADIPYALVSGSARVAIGLIALAYVFVQLTGALGYESCELQGISMVCTDGLSTQAMMEVNLLYGLVAVVGGVIVLVNGGAQFARALKSRGKTMTYEYLCSKGHSWTSK